MITGKVITRDSLITDPTDQTLRVRDLMIKVLPGKETSGDPGFVWKRQEVVTAPGPVYMGCLRQAQ